ncbi:sugar phosphate isomerase/epimerase [Kineococcus xinjiangensis]|uniref:Sugar phosphate isomerase/epimerase n=2 Tax=Kineococcus xinjiangensis TaxID=512762 RepID=A0A2S6IKC9_9ACTN|nr:sugar phosphate isomerase/epimerase family protein [Kineococcus xinjiangensis]PPK94631.1 sugar phosphate isomerase/epimerase [Kineococcus xinjiangensis]
MSSPTQTSDSPAPAGPTTKVWSGYPAELTRENWPITVPMMIHGNTVADGTPVQEASAEQWAEVLDVMVDAGYTSIDPTDTWIQIADLSPARLEEFARTVTAAGLTIPAFSTSRRSVVDPDLGDEHLAYGHRAIDACAAIGIPLVSFGFMRALTPAQAKAMWFWHEPGPVDDPAPEARARAVARIQELARHAAEVGVQVSLEMYEDTYLGTADSAVRFVEEVGLDNVGLNPDFGNFLRLHRPIEDWWYVAEKTMPLANYWHLKNYLRDFDPATGAYFSHPAPLESGTINYRKVIRYAVESGFRGAFCVEHYGGDSISVGATNREYIRRVLPRTIPTP